MADLTGITARDCPLACGPDCVITKGICGHPHKGGLQGKYQNDPDAVRLFQEARRAIARGKLDAADESGGEKPVKAARRAAKRRSPRRRRKAPAAPAPAEEAAAPVR